jgi:hypothetical protein
VRNLAHGDEKSGFCHRSAVEDQWYTIFQMSITAPNHEVRLKRPCAENWYGSKNNIFAAEVAPNANGCSILRDHLPVNRSMK